MLNGIVGYRGTLSRLVTVVEMSSSKMGDIKFIKGSKLVTNIKEILIDGKTSGV